MPLKVLLKFTLKALFTLCKPFTYNYISDIFPKLPQLFLSPGYCKQIVCPQMTELSTRSSAPKN